MGTIVIEQYIRSGSGAQPESPIAKLDQSIKRTGDATTSSTPETVVLHDDTKIVSIYAVEAHRISIGGDTTTNYATINAAERREFGVDGGETLSYRTDA